MDKLKINYWIDIGLAISFFVCFITGLVKLPMLNRLFGLLPGELTVVHDLSGVMLGVLVFIHLVLHWRWIVHVAGGLCGRKHVGCGGKTVGVVMFLVLVLGVLLIQGYVGEGVIVGDRESVSLGCPFGEVDCTYPGNCGRFIDVDEDGVCDHSG